MNFILRIALIRAIGEFTSNADDFSKEELIEMILSSDDQSMPDDLIIWQPYEDTPWSEVKALIFEKADIIKDNMTNDFEFIKKGIIQKMSKEECNINVCRWNMSEIFESGFNGN